MPLLATQSTLQKMFGAQRLTTGQVRRRPGMDVHDQLAGNRTSRNEFRDPNNTDARETRIVSCYRVSGESRGNVT